MLGFDSRGSSHWKVKTESEKFWSFFEAFFLPASFSCCDRWRKFVRRSGRAPPIPPAADPSRPPAVPPLPSERLAWDSRCRSVDPPNSSSSPHDRWRTRGRSAPAASTSPSAVPRRTIELPPAPERRGCLRNFGATAMSLAWPTRLYGGWTMWTNSPSDQHRQPRKSRKVSVTEREASRRDLCNNKKINFC